jgi:ADP-ribose pyrophosphatase YjhB (NUDIX family)
LPTCDTHKLIVDTLVIAEGKVLLVKYKDTKPYEGQTGWFIPDDYMKEPDHPDTTASRVLYEQAGIKAEKIELGFIESFSHGAWHLIFHYKTEIAKAPKVKPGTNIAEARWFPIGKLPPRDECSHHGWAHDVIEKLAVK